MKKFVSFICILLMLLTMTACADETARLEGMSEEKRAQRLLKLAEEALTDAESFVIRRTLTVKNPYFGATISETETTSCVLTKGSYGYLKQTRTQMGAGQNIKSTSVHGYRDGYAFLHYSQDTVSSFFKSPAEEKDFRATTVKDSDTPPLRLLIGKDTCKSITAEHMDDGKWKVICTGFGDAKAAGFLDRQHDYASDLTISHKPWDLEITLIMTEELKPDWVSVNVIFHESKEYPRAEPSALTQYVFQLDTDEAQNNISSIPLEKYTELPDLTVLTSFFDQMTAREKAAKGELTVDTTTLGNDANIVLLHGVGGIEGLQDDVLESVCGEVLLKAAAVDGDLAGLTFLNGGEPSVGDSLLAAAGSVVRGGRHDGD